MSGSHQPYDRQALLRSVKCETMGMEISLSLSYLSKLIMRNVLKH